MTPSRVNKSSSWALTFSGNAAGSVAGAEERRAATRRRALAFIGVTLFAGLIFAVPAGRRPFWSSDEARFALLARDVIDQGRWLVPHLRCDPYLNKPQLYFWSIAVVALPGGRVTEVTAAIPSVVSAIATIAAVMAIGWHVWNWPTGLLAGLILATTLPYSVSAHEVLADVMMTAWLTWAAYFLLVAFRG